MGKWEDAFRAVGAELDALRERVEVLERAGEVRFFPVPAGSRHAESVRVACPHCGAKPGGMCVRVSGPWTGKRADTPHGRRLRLALG